MEKIAKDPFLRFLAKKASEQALPSTVLFELSYGCNYQCVHCFNPTHKALAHELSTEEIERILTEISGMGVIYLNLTGGELFTRPDIFHIFEKSKRLGFLIGINSNGSRITPEMVKKFEAFDILSIGISIYGATAEVYEKMTQTPGSFNAFSGGLEVLSKSHIPVELRMPVTTVNYHEIVQAGEIAKQFGFDFSYTFDIEPGQNGDKGPLQYRLSPEEKMRLTIAFDPGELSEEDDVLNPVKDYLDCACGRGEQFAVNPYGEMNLCVSFPYPKYDLRKGSVKDGWEFLKAARMKLGPNATYECPSCEFRPFCREGRNDAWLETGDASRCLPHFKDWARLEKNYCEARWKVSEKG